MSGASPSDRHTGVQLRGLWLLMARLSWLAFAIAAVGLFAMSLFLHPTFVMQSFPSLSAALKQGPSYDLQRCFLHCHGQVMNPVSLDDPVYLLDIAILAVPLAVSIVLVWFRSRDAAALTAALCLVTFPVAGVSSIHSLASNEVHVRVVYSLVVLVGASSLFFCFYIFPDGRFVPRWIRWFVLLPLTLGLLTSLAELGVIRPLSFWGYRELPLALGTLGSLSVVYAQVYRYRRVSSPVQRQQTKWVVFGLAVALLGASTVGVVAQEIWYPAISHRFVQPPGFPDSGHVFEVIPASAITTTTVLNKAFVLIIPLVLLIAILRYRLWDIDLIINRTLVYGLLTVGLVALYVLTVNGLGAVVQGQAHLASSLLATGLVALVFHPLRTRLQGGVNRLMYGERDDPYAVLSRLGQRLESTLAPDALLPTIVQTIAHSLKLPYAALALQHDGQLALTASIGSPPPAPLTVPLVHQGEPVGQLLLAPRPGERSFSAADRRLLDDLARQAGIAVHAVQLAVALQHSRERLVTLREEERRRLRRDLHDGLGPALAGVLLNLNAIRRQLGSESRVDDLLVQTRSDIQAIIADLRRVVYELRPPALDELGLAGAIRQTAASYEQNGLLITVHTPEALPSLPAAVEVAVYRIVQEALTNVVRHAGAHACKVQLTVSDGLEIEIVDDGAGLPEERQVGVGLTSMKERAAELGGSCVVDTAPEGGTRVRAHLPLVGI